MTGLGAVNGKIASLFAFDDIGQTAMWKNFATARMRSRFGSMGLPEAALGEGCDFKPGSIARREEERTFSECGYPDCRDICPSREEASFKAGGADASFRSPDKKLREARHCCGENTQHRQLGGREDPLEPHPTPIRPLLEPWWVYLFDCFATTRSVSDTSAVQDELDFR